MKPEEIRHLLGGYASGTLSEAEKKLLFEAALDDQVLFDAMADEQALKDLLDDAESRGYLQAVLDEIPVSRGEDLALRSSAAPAQAPLAPAAPAPIRRRETEAVVGKRRPMMWWGLLAAATLATVSVIGILRMDRKPPSVEVAKNMQVAAPTETVASPPSASRAVPKPVVAGKAAQSEMDTKPKTEAARMPPVAEPVRSEELKQAEARKPRDEVPQVPAQTTQSATAPAPPQQQQQPRKEVLQGGLVNPQVSQDQTAQFSLPGVFPPPSARQLYFGPEQTPGGDAGATGGALTETAKDSTDAKKKASSPALASAPAMGGAGAGAIALRTRAAKPAFAMRYKILRKTGSQLVPVPPGTRFHVGDEVELEIEKNSGGTATIDRIADGSTSTVAMAIQTNQMARSVPLTVTGPMELAVILNRAGAVQGIPSQPALQRTEVADGMVYVAEPASSDGQALVVRVLIRVE